MKKYWYFSDFSKETLRSGNSSEAPYDGTAIEYTHNMFSWRNQIDVMSPDKKGYKKSIFIISSLKHML